MNNAWDKEYCEDHKVWWQPTAQVTSCPACDLTESEEYILYDEHEEEIQSRDDEIEKFEKRIESILEKVCNLRDNTEERFIDFNKMKKAELIELIQEFRKDHFEACDSIVIEE